VLALLAFAVAAASLLGAAPSPAGTIVEPWIDTSNRDAVLVAWQVERSRDVPAMEWTGSYDHCAAGSASQQLALATVGRVNFYRAMAGVPASVRLNDEFSAKAQHAALAMSATGRLSHTPDDSFECLDRDGIDAAANSNLYLGRIGPAAIDGYIEDPGDRNRDVGHRNTILHPPTVEIGVGHVAGNQTDHPANALWVFDQRVFDDNPPLRELEGFVAWPPRGYVPAELIHPRWSFGLGGADFDQASVTMRVDGRPIEVEVVTRLSLEGYVPSPIIVWEPDPADLPQLRGEGVDPGGVAPGPDLVVDVEVTGVVVDGARVDFAYQVVLVGSDRPGFELDLGQSPVAEAVRLTVTGAAWVMAAAVPGPGRGH
jgi:uncharacterized protein YkwD